MENIPTKQEVLPVVKSTIAADAQGLLKPQNIEEAFRLAKAYQQSKLLPQRFNSPEMILTAMQFVLELGLKPLTAMRQLAVIQGTPSLFGDLPLSLCFSSGKLESIREWYFAADGREICTRNNNIRDEVFGAGCWVKRKGDPENLETTFTLEEAKRANLLGSSTWKSYPKRMLRYRARSQALKDKFPDALNGLSIAEYDFHEIPSNDGDSQDKPPASRSVNPLKTRVESMILNAEVVEPSQEVTVSSATEPAPGLFETAEPPKLNGEK